MKIQSWKCNIQGSFIHYFSCIVVIFNNILNRDSNLKNAGSEGRYEPRSSMLTMSPSFSSVNQLSHAVVITVIVVAVVVIWVTTARTWTRDHLWLQGHLMSLWPKMVIMIKTFTAHKTILMLHQCPPSEAQLISWIHSIVFISSAWWLENIIKFLSQHLDWWLILIWSGGENVFGHWWLWVWSMGEYSRDWIKYQFKHSIMETKNVCDYFDKKWILSDKLFDIW